jgi:hypothetical protein
MTDTQKMSPVEFLAHVLTPEKQTAHICWQCKYFKWVLKGSGFPPADIIGWCKKIHWPHYWSISDMDVVKKCYAFEAIK